VNGAAQGGRAEAHGRVSQCAVVQEQTVLNLHQLLGGIPRGRVINRAAYVSGVVVLEDSAADLKVRIVAVNASTK
jgi:hypothetical protein